MVMAQPHYLLFCDTQMHSLTSNQQPTLPSQTRSGRWHFVLEKLDGVERFEAADAEHNANQERLALLSVVRGLEALPQPSKVTLVTTSRYVSRGLRFGLNSWRDTEYQWERFGVQMPIRNADLWRRVSVALDFHGVSCRLIQSAEAVSSNRVATAEDPTVNPVVADASCTQPSGRAAASLNAAATAQHRPHLSLLPWRDIWWKLANAWIKWWRGRLQARPVLTGV